jgi:hypothetical protein
MCVLALVCARGVAVRAEDPPEILEGMAWGPWVVRPALDLSVESNTNPLYRSPEDLEASGVGTDRVGEGIASLRAVLPFHESAVRLGYLQSRANYQETEVNNNGYSSADAAVEFRFASGDRVDLRANRTDGAADTIRFDAGEAVFDGTPYTYSTQSAAWERDRPGAFGWKVDFVHAALIFDSTDANFFEYRGGEATAEARWPMGPKLFAFGNIRSRRYDHFRAPDPPGTLYRTEDTNGLRAGMLFRPGTRQTYRVDLGKERSQYPGGTARDFDGWVGSGLVVIEVGPYSRVVAEYSKRPYSSFYGDNNFYLFSGGSVRFEREIGRTRAGAQFSTSKLVYDEPVAGELRSDRILRSDGYATVSFSEFVHARLTVSTQRRRSTIGGLDYDVDVVSLGIVLGYR